MINKEINVAEAKKHFSELLGRVAYGQEKIMIMKRGKPMAVLVPVPKISKENHLSKIQGWLDTDDPFFETIESIMLERSTHAFRILNANAE